VAEDSRSHDAEQRSVELENWLERITGWIGENPVPVFAAVGILLASVAAWQFAVSRAEKREVEASNALDEAQSGYLAAMGAEPGAIDVPQLANPDAAKRIREEYVAKFRAVAEAHPGTLPAALAWLQVADLQAAEPGSDAVLESLQRSLTEQPGNTRLAGLVHQRIAQVYEDRGQLKEAAAEHEAAGAIPDFPLRYLALADAARCYAQAGDPVRALALLDRVESESKDGVALSGPLKSLQRELRAATSP